jgi:hypothetical protein
VNSFSHTGMPASEAFLFRILFCVEAPWNRPFDCPTQDCRTQCRNWGAKDLTPGSGETCRFRMI